MLNLYDKVSEWLALHPITTGGALALILTGIRVIRNQQRPTFATVCLEGVCCGLLSMAFSYAAIGMLGADSSVGVLIGSTAGFIGLDRIKVLFNALLDHYLLKASQSAPDKPEERP